MTPTYRSAPTMLCYAPARTFLDAAAALSHARTAAAAFRVGYQVWEVLAGRPRRLASFAPPRVGR